MPQLDARRPYTDGAVLFAADLDAVVDDIETLLNTTLLNDDNLQNAGITASTKLIDGTVTAGKLGTSAVTTVKIDALAVTTAKIALLNVTTATINDLAVTTGKINDLAVTTGKINDLGVTTGKLNTDAVTTVKITDLNVTTGKINDLAVTAGKLGAGSVTQIKMNSSVNLSSSSSSTSSAVSGSFVTFTNLSTAFTNIAGRNVRIKLQGDGTANSASCVTVTGGTCSIRVLKDGVDIQNIQITTGQYSPGMICFVDLAPAVGTATYAMQGAIGAGSDISVTKVVMIIEEL